MNWEAVSAIAEILGVLTVIGSLIYIGRQINQNTQIARANIVHETNALSNQIFQLIAQDSELADTKKDQKKTGHPRVLIQLS